MHKLGWYPRRYPARVVGLRLRSARSGHLAAEKLSRLRSTPPRAFSDTRLQEGCMASLSEFCAYLGFEVNERVNIANIAPASRVL